MKHASLKAYLSTERFKRFIWPVQHSRLQQRTGALGSDPGPSQGVSKRIRLHPRWVHLDLSRSRALLPEETQAGDVSAYIPTNVISITTVCSCFGAFQ
jgi:F0F1-type ATP synthase alpha subunit